MDEIFELFDLLLTEQQSAAAAATAVLAIVKHADYSILTVS